jgi:MurNAc alpha-1-phosphate uridylyltransferase
MTSTTTSPRRAMVLAAGMGTRMRPLTDNMPKPLVKVAGKALLDHVLDRLAAEGVERAVVNVHHFGEQIIAHLADRRRPQIAISDERGVLLDTGGGVVKALPELGRYHLDRRREAQSGAAGRRLRPRRHGRTAAAGADRRQHRL